MKEGNYWTWNLIDHSHIGYYAPCCTAQSLAWIEDIMAARRYEISLQVLKNISQVSAVNDWNIFSTLEEKFPISKWPCNVLFNYINTNELPNHFTLIVFWCERRDLLCGHNNGDIFTCEDNMWFSHVKISSFHTKAYLVFHWCLYNKNCFQFLPVLQSSQEKLKTMVVQNFFFFGGGGGRDGGINKVHFGQFENDK